LSRGRDRVSVLIEASSSRGLRSVEQKQSVEVRLMSGFPFDLSLALLVQQASRIPTNTILILQRVARGDRIEQRKG
jgi:hypothetical protein